jgi:hypothetical protein
MNTGAYTPDTWIPQTAREWYEWLIREEEKTVAAYRDKPSLLIADYHRERAIARDYEGREILELLQNANDQAAERGERGRVLMELSPGGLIFANTGLAFSVGGVASLQTSHLSPKRRRRQQLIGNKGLGFRSVLNWSRTPIILSNTLCLAYSTEHAKNKLRALTDGHPELARIVSEEQQGGDALILPLLPFPLYSEKGDLSARLADDRGRRIFERCEALLIEGYDTVIGMPFEAPTGIQAAGTQMDEVRPEILLFAQNLGELCFCREGKAPVIWRREGSDEVAEVLANGNLLSRWQIHRKPGKLPAFAIESDQGEATDYEIVVAVPLEGSAATGPLYSHFPTDITLPLPLVCHATLELEQNRKHLQKGRKCNGHVLGTLADFLAEIAEGVAAQATEDVWAGCSMLIPKGEYPPELTREEFPERLIEAAKARRIVPTMGGKAVTPIIARRIPGANPSWIPAKLFPEVVPTRDAGDVRFLSLLDVPLLEVTEIKNRILTRRDDLTVDQRIALIVGLLNQESLIEAYTSALLLDSSGHGLGDGMRVFLAPSGGKIPHLPDWADLRFLNDDMRAKLTQHLRARDNRELQQKLSEFGLLEYSLANVIRALIAEASRVEKANPENRQNYQADLMRTIFELYIAEEPGTKRPEYPERNPVNLPNQSHNEVPATGLYLGMGFGPHGEITQALYESWAPEKLVDPERLWVLTDDREKLKDFLLWVGVAQWPRGIKEQNVSREYLYHVLRTIKFPAQFEERVVTSVSKAHHPSVSDVQSIDGLNEILGKAEPAAIAAWLANDDRAFAWSRQTPEHATLKAVPGGVYKARVYVGPLPSYVRWRVESTPWLRSGDGKTLKPKDCVLGERAIEELFPRPTMPDQEALKRYRIQQGEVLEGWRRAGVLTSLAYLERDEIYAKLLELPQRSPDGKLARPLYHWLLDASETALGGDGPNQMEFLAHGKMWGRHDKEEGYFPVMELHHADAEGLPEALLKRLKIVDLRKRVGADKVERLFGVKPIDRAGIGRRSVAKEIAVGSFQANTDFQGAKPYLHKLRSSQTSQLTQLQVLKDLQLEVCWMLRGELTFEGAPFEFDVPVWGWLIEDKTLYVRSDPAKPMSLADSLLSDAIGEALASTFRIADGGEFARMLVCKEEDRPLLLRRLRGEADLEDMGSIKAEYASFKASATIEARFPVTEPPKVVSPQTEEASRQTLEPGESQLPSETPPGPGDSLQVIEKEHVPEPAPEPRKLQLKTVTSLSSRSGSYRRVTDGDFCERKAIEFEAANDPPRYALRVGQIMGSEGPGCDLLSFASEKDREAFRLGDIRDLNIVVRFIEVKGRGNAGATIELKGNELSAAEKYGERYFLYRLFEADDEAFELTVLRNPLQHKEALEPAVHVIMERAEATQRFSLIGGLKKEAGS